MIFRYIGTTSPHYEIWMLITHRSHPPHRSPHLSEEETSNIYPTRTLTPNHGPGCVLVVFY